MTKLNITFSPDAFEDYKYWQKQDKKLLQKINSLIKSIQREGVLEGEGRPEPLRGDLKSYYSRRINHHEHRVVYKVTDSAILIASCRYHYYK
ncbi:Txe/YoeB family addiction module toxin [Staphylococcus simiae]|uniref:Endoribonuclease YoeB n=1 Tax=Staphylococcus simiae CCM 7213 = CCUG 51256 TaxID=911238 RepID=G5JF61_9STAP|nr:Txe/YoeB family addiction module toxin [Staphylococcus simiae]EHJ09153.1 addiction module antitoxin [Staphylococcus simiae CCM 7213 = CCUG 51256]PNZ13906.1 Txe/YoeB family addiction module toxin [Staphylococcus simiae]SNV58987.1 addiction module, toxin [Staphylococcus simiae]